MTQTEISVVIPLYNDAGSIGAVLEGLARQAGAPAFEVIVVDDGSRDDGPEIARAMGARVETQVNSGPAAARNRGAELARGQIVLFLDADCTPPTDWVRALSAPIRDGGFEASVGTICAANDGPIPRIVQAEVEGRYEGMRQATDGVDFIAAPACGFRRDVFEAIGGFDTALRQAEDVEIAYRTRARGHRIAFVDTVPVAHEHQTGLGEFLAVKHRRAVGRMEVFALFPDKMKSDSWTPMALKLQFGFMGLAVLSLVIWPWAGAMGVGLTLGLLLACACTGLPEILRMARDLRPVSGAVRALFYGVGFVLGRAFMILIAVARVKLRQRWPGRGAAHA
ncbi:MAG: glycosyltransferase family 2 protein [Pelagimonas sp.]|jgi:glycosyltransferase involved in cell wall biosynthesis|nr:glycosyltransferase family 2 protein [Pelagimonas sp.]